MISRKSDRFVLFCVRASGRIQEPVELPEPVHRMLRRFDRRLSQPTLTGPLGGCFDQDHVPVQAAGLSAPERRDDRRK